MPAATQPDPAPDREMTAEFERRRERSRRNLLRANTAVAAVLLAVVGLAAVATFASVRARRDQRRAEEAQSAARAELQHAYLADIRAIRQDKTLGRRPAALEIIRRATALGASAELRNEAVAALALPDFRTESTTAWESGALSYAFDPSLKYCAFSHTNGEVHVVTSSDEKLVQRLSMSAGEIPAEQECPWFMEFSADGSRLSVRYRRGALVVWDWRSARVVFRHDIDKPRRVISRGRFSPDGRHLVAPVFTPADGMGVFELATGRLLAHFPEFSSFRHAAVRPGAPMFAANDGTNVAVVNWETQQHVATFDYSAGVRALAWSPDGRQLVIGGNLLEVHVWDYETRRQRVLGGFKNDTWALAFDPSGDRLATSSHDGVSRLWDLRDGRLLGATRDGWVTQWSSGDRLILERPQRALEIRQLVPSPVLHELIGPADSADTRTMDVSADGNWAISPLGRDRLQVWNLNDTAGPKLQSVEWLRSITFHPSEPRLFILKRNSPESRPYTIGTNGEFQLGEGTPLAALRERRLNLLNVSADGRTVAYVELGAGRAWAGSLAATNPTPLRDIAHNSLADRSGSPRGGGTISVSPDGRWLACGVSPGATTVFETATGNLVNRWIATEANVQFSPDGRWLVSAQQGRTCVIRVSDWQMVWSHDQPRLEQPTTAFSPDGNILAVAKTPQSAVLLDAGTGEELAELQPPDAAPIQTMRWTADARRLVLATRENHLEIWEPATLLKELAALGLAWTPGLRQLPIEPSKDLGQLPTAIVAGTLGIVALIALIALASLRRHRRLIESFADTEALAAQRERELRGEREISRLKSSFVSMVSHEFRTPLGIIQSSAQILDRYLDRLPSDQRKEQLTSITNNVRRMAGLIEEVLLLGKAEAGQMRFTPEPFELPTFCQRLVEEIRLATRHRCPIQLQADSIPDAVGDENLLRHILGNLLSNAVKYSPEGRTVELIVRRHEKHAVFEVRDHGIGIPAADQAQLFTAFHRGSNVGPRHGTGLGLTIAQRCTELHGAELSFTSTEGLGTTFVVKVPLFIDPAGQPNPKP